MRQVYNSQLQAHCGQYGVSTHDTTTARVYGSETPGTINSSDYTVTGDAAKHKHHRNNIERLEVSGSRQIFNTYAVQFDGSNEYFNLSSDSSLDLETFTISAWINFDSTMTNNIVGSVAALGGGVTNRTFFISGSGASRTLGYDTEYTTKHGMFYSDATCSAGKWYHVAMTSNEVYAAPASTIIGSPPKFYINGSLVGTSMDQAPTGSCSASHGAHYIGRSFSANAGSAQYYKGKMDEVSIWDKQLSANEVAEIFRSYPREGPNDLLDHSAKANLIAWYRMGDTSGDAHTKIKNALGVTAIDATGNNFEAADIVASEIQGEYYSVVTASSYDNAFVSHMIPRTDQQTRWITASLI